MSRMIIYNKDRKDVDDFDCTIMYESFKNKIVYESNRYSSRLVCSPRNIKCVIKELEEFINASRNNTSGTCFNWSNHNILTRDEVLVIISELNNIKDRDDCMFINIISGNIQLKELDRKDLNKLSYKELVAISRK